MVCGWRMLPQTLLTQGGGFGNGCLVALFVPSHVVARVEPVVRARRERAAAGGIVCVGHHLGTDGGGSGRPAEPERELRGRRDWQGGHAGQRAAAHAEGVHAGGGGVGVAAHDDAARDAAERAEWRERGGRGGHA